MNNHRGGTARVEGDEKKKKRKFEVIDTEPKPEADDVHRMFIAVDAVGAVRMERKVDPLSDVGYSSQFVVVAVPICVSEGDKRTFGIISETMQKSVYESSGGEDRLTSPHLNIVFNDPEHAWDEPRDESRKPTKLKGRTDISIKIQRSEFLKRVYEVFGNATISLRGSFSRPDFRRGRICPLNLTEEPIELALKPNGETKEINLTFVNGLLGGSAKEIKGNFTIQLKWKGPEPAPDRLPAFKRFVDDIPKDVKILLCDGSAHACHSFLIKDESRVLSTMLESDMLERRTGTIQISDSNVTAETIELFLEYIYKGSLLKAFREFTACTHLLSFSHQYDIPKLEDSMRNLLEEKTEEWFPPVSDMEPFLSFIKNCPDNYSNLRKRIENILARREEESCKEKSSGNDLGKLGACAVEYRGILLADDGWDW